MLSGSLFWDAVTLQIEPCWRCYGVILAVHVVTSLSQAAGVRTYIRSQQHLSCTRLMCDVTRTSSPAGFGAFTSRSCKIAIFVKAETHLSWFVPDWRLGCGFFWRTDFSQSNVKKGQMTATWALRKWSQCPEGCHWSIDLTDMLNISKIQQDTGQGTGDTAFDLSYSANINLTSLRAPWWRHEALQTSGWD